MEKKINPSCPCKVSCPSHGDCEACKAYHKNGKTTCQRIEKKKEAKA